MAPPKASSPASSRSPTPAAPSTSRAAATAAAAPTVLQVKLGSPIPTSFLNAVDLLDHSKKNWPQWKRTVVQCLQFGNLAGYITGAVACPSLSTDPASYENWHANDQTVRVFIGLKA